MIFSLVCHSWIFFVYVNTVSSYSKSKILRCWLKLSQLLLPSSFPIFTHVSARNPTTYLKTTDLPKSSARWRSPRVQTVTTGHDNPHSPSSLHSLSFLFPQDSCPGTLPLLLLFSFYFFPPAVPFDCKGLSISNASLNVWLTHTLTRIHILTFWGKKKIKKCWYVSGGTQRYHLSSQTENETRLKTFLHICTVRRCF